MFVISNIELKVRLFYFTFNYIDLNIVIHDTILLELSELLTTIHALEYLIPRKMSFLITNKFIRI